MLKFGLSFEKFVFEGHTLGNLDKTKIPKNGKNAF
jgi:hypothetical protein